MEKNDEVIVSEIRSFSRFYTNILGLLNQSILDSPYSLTETRILLEISRTKDCTANALIERLDIDRGYMSRILNRFRSDDLITKENSPVDGRMVFLKLTPKGKQILSVLEEKSNNQIRKLISPLTQGEREQLVSAMKYVKDSLSSGEEPIKVRTYKPEDIEYIIKRHRELYKNEYGFTSEFGDYVEKYVIEFDKYHDEIRENIWIAEVSGRPVGVIAIVKVDEFTAQLRWFLIEPEMRSKGLGHKLLQIAIDFCKEKNYKKVLLWTVDKLVTARHLYSSYGFTLTASEENRTWTSDVIKEERWDFIL
jgi:DNA-binding MarR family transcriptional regulator/GNAT superfamily N-acetyltransferase